MPRGPVALLFLASVATPGALAADEAFEAWSPPPEDPPRVERCARRIEALSGEAGASAVAVDGRGFVWGATPDGLLRWDGERARRFRPDPGVLAGTFDFVSAQGDVVVAHDRSFRGFEVVEDRLRRLLPRPDFRITGRPLITDDGLWVVSMPESPDGPFHLSRRDREGVWSHTPLPGLPTDNRVLDLELDADGEGVLIATWDAGLWEVHDGGRLEQRIATTVYGLDALSDGRVVVLRHPSAVLLDADGHLEPLRVRPGGEPIGAHGHHRYVTVDDRDRVHLSNGGHLDTVFPDGSSVCSRERWGRWHFGEVSATDPDGGVWVGSTQGMLRIAAPDGQSWTPESGLSHFGVLDVAPGPTRTWMPQWTGRLSRLDREGQGWRLHNLGDLRVDQVCVGATGTWAPPSIHVEQDRRWVRLDTGEPVRHPRDTDARRCFEDAGSVWLLEADALFQVDQVGIEHGPYARPQQLPHALVRMPGGRLFASTPEQWCEIDEEDLRRGGSWRCVSPDLQPPLRPGPVGRVGDELWMSSPDGVLLHDKGAFEPHPKLDRLARATHVLEPSPRGGTWIRGPYGVARVSVEDSSPAVLEVISDHHGLIRPHDVRESDTGDLWVASACGWSFVSASQRDRPPRPPRIRLSRVQVDGQLVPAGDLSLPASAPPVTLHYATSSYVDPSRLRYRVRLDDGAWSAPSADASLQLLGLAPGTHRVQIAASLQGGPEHLRLDSVPPSEPLDLRIDVAWPWYQQTWFYLLVVALGILIAWAAYRMTLAVQLRLARQRAEIAMDLHDELGAGLGSIRILAGLLSGGDAPLERVQELNARIEHTAVELGGSLTDIVWSLRPTSSTVEALSLYLTERGRDLFASTGVTFRATQPASIPRVELTLAVARQSQLILLEALRNAARHAQASHVELRVLEIGGRWVFEVADDGAGLEVTAGSTRTGGGNGLASMRSRAEAVRAHLEVHSSGVGTRVRLTLPRTSRWRWRGRG